MAYGRQNRSLPYRGGTLKPTPLLTRTSDQQCLCPAESLDPAPFIFIVVSNFDHRPLEGVGMSNNADLQCSHSHCRRALLQGTQSFLLAYLDEWHHHRRAASAQSDNQHLIPPGRYLRDLLSSRTGFQVPNGSSNHTEQVCEICIHNFSCTFSKWIGGEYLPRRSILDRQEY
jgi:hypothetical protein